MIKFEIINLKNVTSTNDIAIKLIKENKKKAGCINAEAQTNGRGTNGKKWISEKGNLFTSLFFPLKKDQISPTSNSNPRAAENRVFEVQKQLP